MQSDHTCDGDVLNQKEAIILNPDKWPSVTSAQWRDWRWQMSQRLTTIDDLREVFSDGLQDNSLIASCISDFRMAITPYFARLIAAQGFNGSLWKQAVPDVAELVKRPHLKLDPLGEEKDSPLPGLVHRYRNRALLLLTDRCAVYCRHCNRRRKAAGIEQDATQEQIAGWLTYLTGHPEVREVILSGGDPLTLTNARLNDFLTQLRKIPTIEIIRIGSRTPVVLPFRITEDLCRILSRHHPLFLNIHVNHPAELTLEMKQACDRLVSAGIPLGSQTVLLKGINDDPNVLKILFSKLLTFRIKPYCLYHCDPARGTAHFRTTIAKGRAIMESLLADLSGLAVPHYVVDGPDGAGKVPVLPDYIEKTFAGGVILRSLQGRVVHYVDDEAEMGG